MTRLKKFIDYLSTKKLITYSILCVITFFILCSTLISSAQSAFLILSALVYLAVCVLCKFEISLLVLLFFYSFKGIGGNVFFGFWWYNIFMMIFLGVGAVRYLIDCINHKNKIYVVPLVLSLVLVAYSFLFFNFDNVSLVLYYVAILGIAYLLFVNAKFFNKVRVIKFFLFGVLVAALIGGILASRASMREISVYIGELRFQALLNHPNQLQIVCCVAIATCIFLYFKKEINMLSFYFACFLFEFIGIMTKSKAFLIVSTMLILVYVFVEILKNRKRGLIVLLFVLIFGGLAFVLFKERFLNIIDRFTSYKYENLLDNIFTGRWTIWKNYIDAWSSSKKSLWFGYGITANELNNVGAHNAYVGLLYKIGLIGFGVVLALICSYLFFVKNKFKRLNNGVNLIPLFVMLLIFFEEGLTELLLVYSSLMIFDAVKQNNVNKVVKVMDDHMLNDKKISVIIPVYKVEEFLNICMESVVNQTYKNLEIILVDDGSPDNCPKICDDWAKKDSRIKVIHKENGGVSSARNAGLDNATGDYICFVDSDDTINSKYCEILLKTLEESQSDVAICSWKKVVDISKPKNEEFNENSLSYESFVGDEAFELLFNKKVPLIMALWTKIYKKSIFDDIRFPIGRTAEDDAVIHKILYKSNKVSFANYQLYNYTKRKDSLTTSNFSKKRLYCLEMIKNRVDFVKEFKPKYLDDAIHHYIRILILYYHYAKWANFEKEILSKIQNEIDKYYKMGYKSKLTTMYYKFPVILNLVLKFREKFV